MKVTGTPALDIPASCVNFVELTLGYEDVGLHY